MGGFLLPFSGPSVGLYAAQTGRGIQGHMDGGKGHTGPINSRHGKPLPVEPVKLPGRSFSWAFRENIPGRGPSFPLLPGADRAGAGAGGGVPGAGGYASGAEAGVSAKMPDKNKKQNLFGNILTFAYNRIILYSAPQRRNTHENRRSSP